MVPPPIIGKMEIPSPGSVDVDPSQQYLAIRVKLSALPVLAEVFYDGRRLLFVHVNRSFETPEFTAQAPSGAPAIQTPPDEEIRWARLPRLGDRVRYDVTLVLAKTVSPAFCQVGPTFLGSFKTR